jgi:hypothetical protein
MRKTILLLCLILPLGGLYAQIVLEHAFDDQSSIDIQIVKLENSGQKTCVVNALDSVTYQCTLYNLDYSVYKTVDMDLSPLITLGNFNTPGLVINYISENTFDADNDIDLLCQFYYFSNSDELYAQVLIFNENGTVQFATDIENTNAVFLNSSIPNGSLHPSLTNTDAGTKMILNSQNINNGEYSFDVYSLPGAVSTNLKSAGAESGNFLNAFPVPASDYVNMDYKLEGDQSSGEIQVLDQQGKTVQKIRIDKNQGQLRIPVNNYRNGLYFYKLISKRGLSRTAKVPVVN